ncbi:Nudix (Nucleoside diphosphate linked moiety X)-type motif 1 [Coemansia sp. RSA 1804]|nr:Nudix (Nucleoside diphosphate linked moiety X)-type motif 1 [Coemansia sp. RSA 1804]
MSQKYFTLIIPFSHTNDQVLLGLKKRGTGTGLWNGFGGKLEKGESIDECAVRELREESGVAAVDMTYVGVLYMNCTDGVGDTMIFVYKCKCGGTIVESDEMRPKWFGVDGIPYSEMYEEAVLWWPVLLDNEDPRFVASFIKQFAG